MSNIQTFLQNILSSRYGKDVRQSIHDAIQEIDNVADVAQNSASNMAKIATEKASEAYESATDASTSASNAKVSEDKSKEYMEEAKRTDVGTLTEEVNAIKNDVEENTTNIAALAESVEGFGQISEQVNINTTNIAALTESVEGFGQISEQVNINTTNIAALAESVDKIEDIGEEVKSIKNELQSEIESVVSDAWNNTTTYTVGQHCIYNNSLWKCLVQHNGQTPTEGTYWTKVSIGSELKNVNDSLNGISIGYKKVLRSSFESDRFVNFGNGIFNSDTTIQDILDYLNTNKIKADEYNIYTNSNSSAFNKSLPLQNGGIIKIIAHSYSFSNGIWDRGFIEFISYNTSEIFINTFIGGTLKGWVKI